MSDSATRMITDEMVDRAVELFAEPRLYEPDQPAKLRQFVESVLTSMGAALVPRLEERLAQGDRLIVSDGGDVVVVSVRLEDEEAEELLDTAGNDSVNFVKRAIASALATRCGYSHRGGEVGVTVTVQPDDALAGRLDLVLQSVESLNTRTDKRWRQLMANLEGLEKAVEALGAEEGAAANELQALVAEIGTLEAGSVTQEQIDAITDRATSVANALSSATAAAEAATAPPAAPAPAESPVTPPPVSEPTPDPVPDPAPADGGTPAEEQAAPDPAPAPEDVPGSPPVEETPAPGEPTEQPAPADPTPAPDAPAPDAPAEGDAAPAEAPAVDGTPAPAEDGEWTQDEG